MTDWGVDSEYGTLRDVLLCPPDNFSWRPTSAISKGTLDSGQVFDRDRALAQHAELVAAYEEAGVNCHFLDPVEGQHYQVFARDSSVGTPWGAFVTAPMQQWRRGEYASVVRFYQGAGIPIWQLASNGAIEGGDVMIVEPGCVVIGTGESRTELPAARQLAAFFEAEGWEARVEPIPGHFLHIDVLLAILAPKLAAVCTEYASGGLVRWLTRQGLRPPRRAGGGRVEAGRERDVAGRRPRAHRRGRHLAERADERPRPAAGRARAGDVHAGWRRRALPVAGASARPRRMSDTGPAIDAARVIADLRELDRRTGGADGAQRVCWTETWREARDFLAELMTEIGVQPERDEAGNLWARLRGGDGDALAVGSHVDSVPSGGWLDGALGVMAGVGVLRAWADSGALPPSPLVLVDWADEEGARFGRSLFGSSAFSGTLDVDAARELSDAEGVRLPDALAENGVELDQVLEAGSRRDGLGAYLELHIEQGPVLETDGAQTAAVNGCTGVERHRFTITGQASHAGTTPMELRRDAGLAAADAALRIEGIGREHDGVATTGVLRLDPGIPTAVAGEAELVADLRHRDAGELAAMLDEARAAINDCAEARECSTADEEIWRIEPLAFDPQLVEYARDACRIASGTERELTSGALHDAAEVSRHVPTAMIFVPSLGGLSHTEREDTDEADLATGIEALGLLANRVLAEL